MERLLDFTDNTPEGLRELVDLYLSQTAEQLGALEAAIASRNAQEARRLAHSCAGASATCGMRRLAPVLREIERLSLEGALAETGKLASDAMREFENIRRFLEDYMTRQTVCVSQN
jgi:HPt (histidine-containing phosphotransfer) domain-containing protein